MRHKILITLMICGFLTLTGCWDLEEVDRRAFASSIGIDIDARGRIVLTAQIPLPQKMLPPGSRAGAGRGKNFTSITATGETVRAAFGVLQAKSYRRLVIQQNKSIVLGESAARIGVTPHLDWLGRSPKAPPQALVFVADGHTAAEILDFTPEQEVLPGLQFIQSAQAEAKFDRTYYIPLWQFRQKMFHPSKDPFAPLISLDERQGTYVEEGLVVFSGDRLAGRLNPVETRLFGILAGLIRGGVFSVQHRPGERLTLRNTHGQTALKVVIRQGRPYFILDVRVRGALSELTSGRSQLTSEDYRAMEKSVAAYLRPRLKAVVRKLQAWNADVIEFGEQLRIQRQDLWRKIDWRRVYPEAGFELAVRVKISEGGVY